MMFDLENRIVTARKRALAYLESMSCETGVGFGWRIGNYHDEHKDPGFLLYGTWCGVYLAVLLGIDSQWSHEYKQSVLNTLQSGQRDDGYFQLSSWSEQNHHLHSWQYALFHATNYCLGALRVLGKAPCKPFSFLEAYQNPTVLQAWLDARCMFLPGMEGNNVVNMASFFLEHARQGFDWAQDAFETLLAWHFRVQNPQTGYFDRLRHNNYANMSHSVTGAAHNLHLFWYSDTRLPRGDLVINDCLCIASNGSSTACTDIDVTDILIHLANDNELADQTLRARIGNALALLMTDLLDRQNPDGGFGDGIRGELNLAGYRTPHHVSNIWATWFRMTTIGMISEALGLSKAGTWRFRDTIGMGYRKRDYLGNNLPPLPFEPPDEAVLATWRKTRRRKASPEIWRRYIAGFARRFHTRLMP